LNYKEGARREGAPAARTYAESAICHSFRLRNQFRDAPLPNRILLERFDKYFIFPRNELSDIGCFFLQKLDLQFDNEDIEIKKWQQIVIRK